MTMLDILFVVFLVSPDKYMGIRKGDKRERTRGAEAAEEVAAKEGNAGKRAREGTIRVDERGRREMGREGQGYNSEAR